MKDALTEIQFGKGAVKVIGKIIVRQTSPLRLNNGKEIESTLILGRVIGKLTQEFDESLSFCEKIDLDEMWEVDLIIIPRAKYRGSKEGQECLGGLNAAQVLGTNWGNRERYKEKFFP